MNMDINDNSLTRHMDYFYSAMMLNTDINFKTLKELTDKNVISGYRDMYDIKLLKQITKQDLDLSPMTVSRIMKLAESFDKIDKIAKGYEQIGNANNIRVISCEDEEYPYNWKVLSGMPKVFYSIGNYDLIQRLDLSGSAAVVGSRNPSKYALYATEKICRELGEKGITVVSGMACGIDRQAHMASVDTKGGTIAVLAGGADNIYPAANQDIYHLIRSKGLIISEMPPGQKPMKQYFPSRNRLIAGLSDCTLVMEAGNASGTLHTASFAAGQGKDVFVLPNNIYYENAMGGLKLLEDGGSVLLGTDNVIDSISYALIYKRMNMGCTAEICYQDDRKEAYETKQCIEGIRQLAKVKPEILDDDQWKLLITDALTLRSLCIDELCVITTLPFYKVSRLLTELELNGTVCQDKGKYSLTFV